MLFTFPSRYWFAIGLQGVFSLAGWSRLIHAGFLVTRATQDPAGDRVRACTGLSPSTAGLSRPFHLERFSRIAVLLPRACLDMHGLGYSPFARHYWGNHCCFLFLRVLRCFSSPRSPHHAIHGDNHQKVAGLSHSEIVGSRDICASPTLSQLIASFIASWSQGIRHAPFSAFCCFCVRPGDDPGRTVPAATKAARSFLFFSLAIRLIYFNSVISMS